MPDALDELAALARDAHDNPMILHGGLTLPKPLDAARVLALVEQAKAERDEGQWHAAELAWDEGAAWDPDAWLMSDGDPNPYREA